MNKKLALALILLIAIIMISCTNTTENNDIIETFESIVETIATIPLETIMPTLPKEINPILFDENITFSYEYISNDNMIPYVLYAPSITTTNESIPLIVWLHGMGERNVSKELFLERGLPKILNNWSLDGFNAYVLCPHLKGTSNNWCSPYSVNRLQNLLDVIIDEYNIDTNNIVIIGHSMGGYGAVYMAYHLEEYFSKLVILSGYPCDVNLLDISIPTIGYVGTSNMGEDQTCIKFMKNNFIPVFGKENAFIMNASHTSLPNIVFNEDKDCNNQSDLIEWMFRNN